MRSSDEIAGRHRIAYLVSHPIQYQAPLLRYLADQHDFDIHVYFRSDLSVGQFYDEGFGTAIHWDVSLLDGYRHEFLPAIGPTDRIDLLRPINYGMARRLWTGRYDALWVHGYAPWFNWVAMAAAKLAFMPVLVRDEATSQSKPRSPLKAFIKRHLFFRLLNVMADGYLAIGSLNRRYYVENGIDGRRVFPGPYCVDNAYFGELAKAAAPHREELRAKLGLQPMRPVILYASKLQRRKRPDDLLAAFSLLSQAGWKGAKPYLLFVGDGEMLAELEEAARPHGEDVRFLGFRNQSELPAFFDLCDLFVLPSLAEPWGLIVNEVMSCARPVVVSDEVGCWPDLVKDGVNGFVFPAKDIRALASSLARLLEDEALRMSMGKAGRDIIESWGFPQFADGLREAMAAVSRRR